LVNLNIYYYTILNVIWLQSTKYLLYNLMYYFDAKYKENGAIKVIDIPKRFAIRFPTYPC